MKPLGLVFLSVILVACNPSQAGRQWLDRPERKLSTYTASVAGPLVDRIAPMPPVVLKYLQAMAPQSNFQSYQPTEAEIVLFQRYFDLLPPNYKSTMEAKVAKIYFVDHFDSGGMSDTVFRNKNELFVVLYLNRELLNASLSDWISFRDNSSFQPTEGVSLLSVTSGDYKGLIHTLVHEASHIYDYYYHTTPYVEEFQKDGTTAQTTAFVQSVWTDLKKATPENDVLGDSKFSGYGLRGKIDGGTARSLYGRLRTSPFASLYGATSWAEDFAESFTWWFLKEEMGISYSVSVLVDGQEAERFVPFESESSKARVVLLESIARGSSATLSF